MGSPEFTPRLSPRFVEIFPKEVNGRELLLFNGHSDELLRQIVENSRQEHILKSTPGDAGRRFSTVETAAEWARERSLYVLSDRNEVAGIVWYGSKPLSGQFNGAETANHTFAIRLYDGYVGKGLAGTFMQETLVDYMADLSSSGRLEDFGGIWLETDTVNTSARHAYAGQGYEEINDDGQRVTMVLRPDAIAFDPPAA